MFLLSPSVDDIEIALLKPGIPIINLYVGLREAVSNSTQAFLKYGFENSNAFNSP
jgi:hypothetical protein